MGGEASEGSAIERKGPRESDAQDAQSGGRDLRRVWRTRRPVRVVVSL
jgi:hypothetical protein